MPSTLATSLPIGLTLSKKRGIITELVIWFSGVALLAISAQIAIPWHPVPVTLQTLGIMLVGLGVGFKRGLSISAGYVFLGALGLPIFNQFSGGISSLLGPTGGYLIGMILASTLLGFWAERGWDRSIWKLSLGIILAEALIFSFGVAVLSAFVGFKGAIVVGFVPFIAIELLKIAMVSVLLPCLWKFKHKLNLTS